MRRGQLSWGVLAALLAWPATTGAQVLFYSDTYQPSPAIRRCAPGGAGLVSLPLPASTFPEGLAYDAAGNKLYWVEAAYSGARIRVSNGGLAPGTTVLSGLGSVRGIAVDAAGNWMYWTASEQGAVTINRAHLNGTGREILFSLPDGFNPRQCALHLAAGKLYWCDMEFNAWIRCNLDGTAGEYLPMAGDARPYGIAIDAARNTVWWSQYGTGDLVSTPIPGPAVDPPSVVSEGGRPSLEARSQALLASIRERRALPEASQAQVNGLPNITHLALDPATGAVYFTQAATDGNPGMVRRVNFDGTGLVTIPVVENAFGGIAWSPVSLLDVPGGEPEPRATAAWSLRAPNPAKAGDAIDFSLPTEGDVRLDVFDASGRRVATLAEGMHAAGAHRVTWTGQTVSGRAAPGVYVLRIEFAGKRLTQRVSWLK